MDSPPPLGGRLAPSSRRWRYDRSGLPSPPFLCLACLLASPPFCIPMACHGGWRVGEARALPCRAVPGRRGVPACAWCGGGGESIHILRRRSFQLSPSSPVTRATTSTPRSAGQARAGMGGSGCPEHLDPFIVPTEIGLCPPCGVVSRSGRRLYGSGARPRPTPHSTSTGDAPWEGSGRVSSRGSRRGGGAVPLASAHDCVSFRWAGEGVSYWGLGPQIGRVVGSTPDYRT